MKKIRRLFMSSFRWRLFINLLMSFALTLLLYALLMITCTYVLHISEEYSYLSSSICFIISFIFFTIIFFNLISFTLKYITDLSTTIQLVAEGDYQTRCEIEYDDELGFLAANINALALTLKDKQKESEILKENERLAFENERLAEKQKNDLITNVAHDLRTPLTSIIGYLELIKNNHELTQEEIFKYSSVAFDKSLKLQTLMDDLFEFTKLDNADIKLNLNQINITELILQLADEFYPTFQEHDLTLRQDIDNQNLFVLADGQLMARVFENLISNAVKYGDDHGYIDISIQSSNHHIIIGISNYGDKISASDIPYIFDKFYRSDASRNSTGGSGLGLAISKNIIELHHGHINVQSKENKTTFFVRLRREQN